MHAWDGGEGVKARRLADVILSVNIYCLHVFMYLCMDGWMDGFLYFIQLSFRYVLYI